MRAIVYALLSGLLLALAMGAGGAFLRADFAAQSAHEAHASQKVVAGLLWQDLEQKRKLEMRLLDVLCTREVNMERLAIELSSGAVEPEAIDRSAQRFADTMGDGEIAVVENKGPRVTVLGRSEHFPSIDVRVEMLGRAGSGHVLVHDRDERPYLAIPCLRKVGAPWLVHVRSLEALREDVRESVRPSEVVIVRNTELSEREVVAFTAKDEDGSGYSLVLRMPEAKPSYLDLALWVVVLAAFLVAGTVGYFVGRRADRHEQALATIEQAARRVAQGDLVTGIDLRIGDRADQTFQTFDRMTRELREMRERLAEAEREAAFRDVARRIAHEIKNPLSPIRMAIETLRRARQRELPDFGEIFEESTRAILEEVKRMERIVREFGEFARLPKAVPGELDLGQLVRDTVQLYVPEGTELTLAIDDGAPRVRADREQLTQVLVNLLQNALDAARASTPSRVRIAVARTGSGAMFVVEDNGPGIRPEDRERVFEPYFTTKDEGTGLGLSIVKRIVSDHRGQIDVAASSLGGASVRVSLPANDALAETRPQP